MPNMHESPLAKIKVAVVVNDGVADLYYRDIEVVVKDGDTVTVNLPLRLRIDESHGWTLKIKENDEPRLDPANDIR